MPVYANQFGSVQTAYVAYQKYDLGTLSPLTLSWPTSYQDSPNVVAAYMDFTNSTSISSPTVQLPDATQVSVGQNFIISNLNTETIFLLDYTGAQIDSIAGSIIKYYILADNSTPGGDWHNSTFGAGTSQATASELAGYGLNALIIGSSDGTKLNTEINPTLLPSGISQYNIQVSDYASLLVWVSGTGALNLPAASSTPTSIQVPAAYYVSINNAGSGQLTIASSEPSIGIQGQSSIILNPGQTVILISCGDAVTIDSYPTKWFTLGLGQQNILGITYLSIPLIGTGNYTLTFSQASNEILEFTGSLTGKVFFPNSDGQWSVFNNTSNPLTIQLAGSSGTGTGTAYTLAVGSRYIYYSNSVSLFDVPYPESSGGFVSFTGTPPTTAGIIATYADTTGEIINATGVGLGSLTPVTSDLAVTALQNLNAVSFADSGNGLLMLGSQVGMEMIEQVSEVCAIFNGGLPSGGLSTVNTLVEIRSPTTTPMALQLSRLAGASLPNPGAEGAGLIAYNTTSNVFEGYNGTSWIALGGGGTLPGPGIIVTNGSGTSSAVSSLVDTNTSANGNLLLGLGITPGGTSTTAFGYQALAVNTGQDNTAGGYQSQASNVGGNYNTSFGFQSLFANVNGSSCTAFGLYALAASTQDRNTAVGEGALSRMQDGANNVAMGFSAGDQYVQYDGCIFIGSQANANNNALSESICIGRNAAVGASQAIVIGGNASVGENGGGIQDTSSIVIGYNSSIGTSDGGLGALNSIILGANSSVGVGTPDITNSIAIGSNVNIEVPNTLVLGNDCLVGIGTSTPDSALHILAQTNADARIHLGPPTATPATPAANHTILYNNVASSTGFLAVAGSAAYSSGNLVTAQSNITAGTGTFVAGSVSMTITTTAVQANSLILLTYRDFTSGEGGQLSAPVAGRIVGTSFTVNSGTPAASFTFDWLIVNPM